MTLSVQCPNCFETISIIVFVEDGQSQQFTYDCEVCCHPMELTVEFTESDDSEDGFEPSVSVDRA